MKKVNSYRIAMIGAGNVGTHLAKALEYAGHKVTDVYSRDLKNAKELTKGFYNATPTDSLDFSKSQADVFIIAVKDDAIPFIVKKIVLPEGVLVVHTSGAVSIDALSSLPVAIGVLYPVQTFSRNSKLDMTQVPFCIEGQDEEVVDVLTSVASALSTHIHIVNSEQRKALHLAAVFACNFSNHLIKIAKDIVVTEGMDFQILKPLIAETVNKALLVSPEQGQTGPAIRKDMTTIKAHLHFLKGNPELSAIYEHITQSIIDTYE